MESESESSEQTLRQQRSVTIALTSRVVSLLLRILGATWRLEVRGTNPVDAAWNDPSLPAPVGVFWHRGILVAAWLFRDRGACAGISRSRDGEWVGALLDRLGYAPSARGSSSRGAAALLRGLVAGAREGRTTAVVLDGPRGPARRAKPGVAALARITGHPIHLGAISARPAKRFGSWDGTLLPGPFARVVVEFSSPIPAPREVGEEAAVAEHVESVLNEATDRLDDELGLRDPNRPAPAEPPT